MTFALQSNKISSICLTVRYFQIGFSTEHLEHFQNIATLNTQPSGQMWGGDEELEAEGLNCGRIPIRTLGFWVLSQEQNVLFWLLAETPSMAKGYQHFSGKSFNLYSPPQEEWELREVTLHKPWCLSPSQLSGFLGPRAVDHLLLLSQQCCAHHSPCLQP